MQFKTILTLMMILVGILGTGNYNNPFHTLFNVYFSQQMRRAEESRGGRRAGGGGRKEAVANGQWPMVAFQPKRQPSVKRQQQHQKFKTSFLLEGIKENDYILKRCMNLKRIQGILSIQKVCLKLCFIFLVKQFGRFNCLTSKNCLHPQAGILFHSFDSYNICTQDFKIFFTCLVFNAYIGAFNFIA